jgi:hypothetical protein
MSALEITALPAQAETTPRPELKVVRETPEIAAARDESRSSLRTLAELVGYPAEWADYLEAEAFSHGVVWRAVSQAG